MRIDVRGRSAALLKRLLVFWPRVLMAARQTSTIIANIMAYSTAVGPSSLVKNRRAANTTFFMMHLDALS